MINTEILNSKLHVLEEIIDYTFKDSQNAILALTHSSFANEKKDGKFKSNERLEFLGDSILNIIISENIYFNYNDLAEGELTRVRASIVCEQSLMLCAKKIRLGEFLLLGKGEEMTGGRSRISILSDAFEALIGAIYIDGGMECAKKFVLEQMQKLIDYPSNELLFTDYKTQFQERIQKSGENRIIYEILEERGPDHNKTFISRVKVADEVVGIGEGRSKKEAEQSAARAALEKCGGLVEI